MKSDLRTRVWSAVDELVRDHRSFPNANWVLPPAELHRLAAISDQLRPKDPEVAHGWLFDTQLPHLGDNAANIGERDRELAELRRAAVKEVMAAGGPEALLRFARSVEQTGFVGQAAAHADLDLDDLTLSLLDSSDDKLAFFGRTYGYAKTSRLGATWTREQIAKSEGRPVAQAQLLLGLDDLKGAWATAAGLGSAVEEAYWKEFRIEGRGADFALLNKAAHSLLRFGRPLAALDLMSMYARRSDRPLDPELVAQGLETLTRLPGDHPEPRRVSAYEVGELLDYLRDVKFDETRLGQLEWRLLPAREFDARSPVLERLIARDPAFFVELISLVYKPREGEPSAQVAEHVARNAYRLLDDWSVVPGSTDSGTVDEDALQKWVTDVRQLLETANRREVGDIHIGKVLAHAGSDPDGNWPTRPVRSVIERIASSDLEDGLRTQIVNERGVSTRGLLDGGAQERSLADKWQERAQRIRDQWPRTAAVLESVATSYAHEAREHDAQSERVRQGLSP